MCRFIVLSEVVLKLKGDLTPQQHILCNDIPSHAQFERPLPALKWKAFSVYHTVGRIDIPRLYV